MNRHVMELLRNPLFVWMISYLKCRRLVWSNRNKHLKVGANCAFNNVSFGDYNTFYDNISVKNASIGDFVYVGEMTKIENAEIGCYCSIGPHSKLGMGLHPYNYISTFPLFFSTRKQCQITFAKKDYFVEHGKINVGNDVWIGSHVLIMDNVTIGDGAVIAAGAVVTKDVAPYEIVGGVPAKFLRKRFSDDKVELLLKFKWWKKDRKWLEDHHERFNNPDDFFAELMSENA